MRVQSIQGTVFEFPQNDTIIIIIIINDFAAHVPRTHVAMGSNEAIKNWFLLFSSSSIDDFPIW